MLLPEPQRVLFSFSPVHLMQCEVDLGAMCMAYSLVDVLTLKMAVILFH